MKKLFTILLAVFLTATVWAQSPNKMSYQAVIRNNNNNLVVNSNVGMQISILQYSTSGTPVYIERQFPTTNANGLVSIQIGAGTVVAGNFASIVWGNGPYFVKTETDLNGGANYTITGISQLLSVPYALHAKTAESVSGTITETDPVFTAWDKDYADLINTPAAADGSETKVTAGTNVTVTGSGTTASPYVVNATAGSGSTTYSVGDFAQGGIVFWVDETGQHGLVAAKEDQSTGVRWYAGTYGNTQAKGDGPFSGEANTSIIIAAQVAIGDDGSTYAARICNELQVTEGGKTYGDWYLPSKEELDLMYQNKATIDATAGVNGGSGFASAYYWSSTEYNNVYAWRQVFVNGYQGTNDKDYTSRVRAVRAF